jgi:hypothetical protein
LWGKGLRAFLEVPLPLPHSLPNTLRLSQEIRLLPLLSSFHNQADGLPLPILDDTHHSVKKPGIRRPKMKDLAKVLLLIIVIMGLSVLASVAAGEVKLAKS